MITKNGYFLIYGSLTLNLLSILFSIPWLYVFSLTFLFIVFMQALSFYRVKKRIKNLRISRELEKELHRFEKANVSLTIISEKEIPYAVIIDEIPSGFELIGGNIGFKGRLKAGETRISYIIEPKEIGKHVFRKIKIISFDSLHIFFIEKEIEIESKVYCYPSRPSMNISDLMRSFLLYAETGQRSSKKRGEGFEFYSAREYTYGDDLKRIAWYQVAKSPERKLFIIEKEEEKKRDFRIFIPLTETIFEGLEGKRKIDWIADVIISFAKLMTRLNTNLDIVFLKEEKLEEFRIRNSLDLFKLIKYFGELEVKDYNLNEKELMKKILERFGIGSFILILADRGISKLNDDFLKEFSEKMNIEILLIKTLEKKNKEKILLNLIRKYEEIEIEKIGERLRKLKIEYNICEPRDIVKNIIRIYSSGSIYKEYMKYG